MTRAGNRLAVVLLVIPLAFGVPAMAYEEPDYDLLEETSEYELRDYTRYLVAETAVDGQFSDTGRQAFRRLAGYIFGGNHAAGASTEKDSVRMSMTVPVESSAPDEEARRYRYRFVMEDRYTLETLPVPDDPAVELRAVPARTVAVRRYSGLWSIANYRRNEQALLEALAADGIEVVGEPWLARYNGPLTPFFLRRNEVLVEVRRQDDRKTAKNR